MCDVSCGFFEDILYQVKEVFIHHSLRVFTMNGCWMCFLHLLIWSYSFPFFTSQIQWIILILIKIKFTLIKQVCIPRITLHVKVCHIVGFDLLTSYNFCIYVKVRFWSGGFFPSYGFLSDFGVWIMLAHGIR